ncbi:MAG: hypothetical protein M1834_003925 [Cirrosporium novae-zelandiae]|nr:MAG: hypothetical protein M1834_003925 [Cirrosporium novae-zelandiae]
MATQDLQGSERTVNGNGNHHLSAKEDPDDALRKIRTAGSISISPELFEKIYLSPQNQVKGDLRKTFANPTPLALVGFLLSLTPLSCILMGWRGAGGSGASDVAAYWFFGGILMLLGAIGEFILGNTFPFIVFGSFGGFWLTFAGTLTPSMNAYGAYSTTGNVAEGLQEPEFYASFAFFWLWMSILSFIFLICSLRTNMVFFVIFITLTTAFALLSGAYWQTANGNTSLASTLTIAAGAFTFVTCLAGWWIFTAQMLFAVDFPINLPIFDISHIIKGASEKKKVSEDTA